MPTIEDDFATVLVGLTVASDEAPHALARIKEDRARLVAALKAAHPLLIAYGNRCGSSDMSGRRTEIFSVEQQIHAALSGDPS